MGLNAKDAKGSGKTTPILPAGSYPARIVQVVDLGLQLGGQYMGEEKDPVRKILITYELVDEFLPDEEGNPQEDKPRWVSEEFPLYNLKADKARSTIRYKSLDAKETCGGDWTKLLDAPCNVTLIVNQGKGKNAGKEFNNVAGVAVPRPREIANWPALVNAPVAFDLDAPSLESFNKLPDWIKKKITTNLEYNGSRLQALLDGKTPAPERTELAKELDDEAPF